MKVRLIAIGGKMPGWVTQGYDEYAKRLPSDLALELVELPLGHRGKGADLARAKRQEGDQMLAAIPKGDRVVALGRPDRHRPATPRRPPTGTSPRTASTSCSQGIAILTSAPSCWTATMARPTRSTQRP